MQFDPNYLNGVAAAISQSSSVESNLTAELSSGLRVTSLDVDPAAAAQASQLGSQIAQDDSYVQAASGKQAVLQVTDSTLGEVVTQLTTAISLAVQGSNGTQNAANTQTVAQQLTGIRDQVLALANTSYLGTHLFSGSQGSLTPFTVDTSTNPATTSYAGDMQVQSIETPAGQKIQVNLPGLSVFGGGGTGVFDALNQLISDFSSGGASGNAAVDVSVLTTAVGQVSSQRSILDSSLSRLQSSSQDTQTAVSQLTVQQTTLVSADMSSVATQLKSAETQHQALLSVMTALEGTNLFSYMK